jgi:hypothetical protein
MAWNSRSISLLLVFGLMCAALVTLHRADSFAETIVSELIAGGCVGFFVMHFKNKTRNKAR